MPRGMAGSRCDRPGSVARETEGVPSGRCGRGHFQDRRCYAQSTGCDADNARLCAVHRYHYHDVSGLEADAVAVAPDGRWGAIEVKVSPAAVDTAAESLKKLAAKVDGSVGRMAFLAVVTSAGYAYRRPDGVYVVPASCLAP